jgi:hypothetical protein
MLEVGKAANRRAFLALATQMQVGRKGDVMGE